MSQAHATRWIAGLFLVAGTVPSALGAESDPLAELARRRPRVSAGATVSGRDEITAEARALLRSPKPCVDAAVARTEVSSASPMALGETLVIRKDDDFPITPVFEYEGPLAVSTGPAGPTDFLAFRFSTKEIAQELPVTVNAIQLGFDNLRGRVSWPVVGLAREDFLRPFEPGALVASVAPFADPATSPLLPAPAGSVPDRFARLRVPLAPPVQVVEFRAVDDGMWSDNFNRPSDELLDHTGSDWAECDFTTCVANLSNPLQALLDVTSNRVVKRLQGDRFAAKFPAQSAYDRRPYAEDRDFALLVTYDVSNPAADRAGVFFRYQGPNRFYVAQYRKSSNSIGLWAFRPGGPPVLLQDSGPLPGNPVTGTLAVSVSGAKPPTHIVVNLNGTMLFAVADSTYAYVGLLAGLASLTVAGDPPSSLEAFDDYTVQRNPDLFAIVGLPPGGTSALPAERSPDSVGHRNVLTSTDGTSYSLLASEASCVQPPNGFASLEVQDTTTDTPTPIDNVFRVETKLATLPVTCASCATTLNLCAADTGPLDRTAAVLETGRPFDIGVSWWNEHSLDVSRLLFEVVLWQGTCGSGTPVLDRLVTPLADTGQATAGGPVHRTLLGPAASYTAPAGAGGAYCAQVYELYDLNSDGCPDGYEADCVTCNCTSDPDTNPATAFISRNLWVYDPCTPATTSELVRNSLRLTKNRATLADTDVHAGSTAPVGRFYNLHTTSDKTALLEPNIRTNVPPYLPRFFSLAPVARTETLPEPLPTGIVYIALFQADGCPSNWSLPDP